MTTMTREISNYDDVIDSRDVIERIAELEALLHDEITVEDRTELDMLYQLASEGEQYAPDWQHGAALIRDSYFVTYAQELAEDIGALEHRHEWPGRHIDWEAAAEELQTDYTSIEWDGVTYWVR
jgi:antirestriction protein